MDSPEVDRRIDELYESPPEDFTAARNALAKALRAEKLRDDAGHVAKLRRPTVAAWAVNQTVRRNRDRFDGLLAAGADVRRAQRRALSGVKQSGLREASRTRRTLVDELTALAATILTEHGASAESHRADIAATFDAVSTDEEAADIVGAARLAAPVPVSSGFGSFDGLTVLEPQEPDSDDGDQAATDDGAADDERERAAQRRREAMRAVQEARRLLEDAQASARRAAKDASKRADAAATAARSAEAAEDTARRKRDEADALAERAQQAQTALDDAQHQAQRLTGELDAREQELNDLKA